MELMITEHFTNGDGSTPLYVARQNIMPGYCGWPLAKDAPFKENLDRYIMAFHGAGLIGKWTKDILKTSRKESLAKQRMRMDQGGFRSAEVVQTGGGGGGGVITALTIIHMQGPLFLLVIGQLLSTAAMVLEVSVVWWARPRSRAGPVAPQL
ncbi:uncharacterized protein [Panulirus ornatus]|uniref:uncharacterized protein n=1 Tax=Panulirus ornatus TaxID=150431 RepID=UPI003A8767A4